MLKETVYTTIGAAALAADFVTSPTRQQNWLKKAERRGGKLAQSSRLQVRPYQRRLESALEDVRRNTLGLIGLAEEQTEKAAAATRSTARKTARRARRSTPRVTATSRRVRPRRTSASRPRRVRATTVTVQTPTAQAS